MNSSEKKFICAISFFFFYELPRMLRCELLKETYGLFDCPLLSGQSDRLFLTQDFTQAEQDLRFPGIGPASVRIALIGRTFSHWGKISPLYFLFLYHSKTFCFCFFPLFSRSHRPASTEKANFYVHIMFLTRL